MLQKHVLIVDDDSDVRAVIADILEDSGCQVTSVTGGQPMRAALESGAPFAAVVLDTLMPGEKSASLALYAKELGLPVVMISGSPDAIKFAYEHGLQLLAKPFDSRTLSAALEQALASGAHGQRPIDPK